MSQNHPDLPKNDQRPETNNHKKLFCCSTNDLKLHQCRTCPDFRTNFLTVLKKHIKSGHRNPTERDLKKIRTKHQEILNHETWGHKPNCLWYKCGKCDFHTDHKSSFKRHNWMNHQIAGELFKCGDNPERYRCPCGKFSSNLLVDIKHHKAHGHSNKVPRRRPYKCGCLETFSEYIWIRHKTFEVCNSQTEIKTKRKETLENVRVYNCDCCNFQTKFRGNLLRHLKKHTSSWLKCDLCFFRTKYPFSMTIHKKSMHEIGVRWFHCESCFFKTKRKYSLKLHKQNKHDNWFHCNHCSYKGSSDFPILVCPKCGTKTRQKKLGVKHNEKFYQCQYCPHKSRRRYNLKTHVIQKHTDSERIQWVHCDHCEFKAKTKSILTRHNRERHSEERFDCAHCGYGTRSKRLLILHMKNKHVRGGKQMKG